MPIVFRHTPSSYTTGLAALLVGIDQATRATRAQDIQTQQRTYESIGRGIETAGRSFLTTSIERSRQDAWTQRQEQQQQNVLQRQDQAQALSIERERLQRDRHVMNLPPHAQIEYVTNLREMRRIRTQGPDDPAVTERMLAPLIQSNEAILADNPPPKIPTAQEDAAAGNISFFPEHGVGMYRDYRNGWQMRRIGGGSSTVGFKDVYPIYRDYLGLLEAEADERFPTDDARRDEAMRRTNEFISQFRAGQVTAPRPSGGLPPLTSEAARGELAQRYAPPDPTGLAEPGAMYFEQVQERAQQDLNNSFQSILEIVDGIKRAGFPERNPGKWPELALLQAQAHAKHAMGILRLMVPTLSAEERLAIKDQVGFLTEILKAKVGTR